MALYDKIKSIAKSQGIPIYKIEENLDIASGSLCKWNEVNPGIDKVLKVANYLGTTVEELVKGE